MDHILSCMSHILDLMKLFIGVRMHMAFGDLRKTKL